MNETTQWISGCIVAVLMLAMLIAGPVSCAILAQQQATKRAEVVCTGDLKTDPIRAAACIMAVNNAKMAGQ